MSPRLVCLCGALATAAAAIILRPAPPLSAQERDRVALDGDTPIERQLARGEDHRYALALADGEYARVTVDQLGIDAIVEVSGADGRLVAVFQDDVRPYGREDVEVVADAAGTCTIAVKAARGSRAPGAYAIRVAARREATPADRSMHDARTLRTAAARLQRDGRFDAARVLLERALANVENARGVDDVQLAAVAAQLGDVYRDLPDDVRSEAQFERAIAILDRALGADHPTTAIVRSRLALLYQKTGQRVKAEALVRDAQKVVVTQLGGETPWLVDILMTQAGLRSDAGDLQQFSEIVGRAMAIAERIGDTESASYVALLNDLGEARRRADDYEGAEELYQRSLAVGERVLGRDNYFNATALQNLGIVARERKDYAAAQAYYARALAIRERVVGSDHPDVAQLLNNLANVYRATGDVATSLELHLRALHIWETAAGPYQQATLLSSGNIARTYAAAGDIASAVAYQRRTDAILEKELALNVAIGSERQKMAFVRSESERTDRTLSLQLHEAAGYADASALAALVLLQRKGRVLDAMVDTFAAVRRRVADPRDRDLLDRLKEATSKVARLALAAPRAMEADERQRAIKDLEAEKERLEAEVSEHSAEFRAQTQPVTLESVQAAIPDDAALVEFAIFRPFDPRAERNAESYGPPHYAAYVVRRRAPPQGFDLGPASAIDAAIEALRQEVRDPKRPGVEARARAVDDLVMRPIRPAFAGAARLLISPDGALNLVPFDALVDEQGRYLIERFAVTYLTSGRDLLRMQVPRAAGTGPVIVADPLFGDPSSAARLERPTRHHASARAMRRSVTTGDDMTTVYFAPLAATADEGRAIKALFPEATLLTGRQATKDTLQRVEAPRILHIASHGFFLRDGAHDAAPRGAAAAAGTRTTTASAAVGNPLLRSGLALAGANLEGDSRDQGILTALEASSLNLWGTKLVTLSACDTGVGEVRNGEGVYGLRRAFVLAGTETLVMSLWPVSDYVARETMVAFYTRLREGLGRGDALRQAKLAMLSRASRRHPFYWASFIQSGEWANLDGARQP